MWSVNRFLRWQRFLHERKIPLLPRLISIYLRIVFACDIPFEADIHESVIFHHSGLGVVINKSAKIGEGSRILQGVTLGGNFGRTIELNGQTIHAPQLGRNVFVSVGAKILGPVIIGDNAIIGAGAVVIEDVPENCTVAGVPAKIIKVNE